MKSSLLKILSICGGVAGIACAVGITLASTGSKKQLTDLTISSVGSEHIPGDSSRELNPEYNFQGLGNQINQEFKKKQGTTSLQNRDLTGQEEFKKMLGDNSEEGKGIIHQEKGKNCSSSLKGMRVYCGFLEIYEKNRNFDYKLKIMHETKSTESENDGWRVNVIRKNRNSSQIEHGDFQDTAKEGKWEDKNTLKFEKLLAFDSGQTQEEGEKTEISFREEA